MNKWLSCLVCLLCCIHVCAQRNILLESASLYKADTCLLYGYVNAAPVLLGESIVKTQGNVTLQDTVLDRNAAGIYVIVLPRAINGGSVTVVYSGAEQSYHIKCYGDNVVFEGSEINNTYTTYLKEAQKTYSMLHQWHADYLNEQGEYKKKAIREKSIASLQFIYDYGERIANGYKNTFLAKLIRCNNVRPLPDIAWNEEYATMKPGEKKYKSVADFIRQYYWDGVDFTDTALLYTPFVAGKAQQYAHMFHPEDTLNSTGAMLELLQKASVEPLVYRVVTEAITDVCAKPNTYLYNEALAIQLLQHEDAQTFTPEWRHIYIASRLGTLGKNRPGSKAATITLRDVQERKHALADVQTPYTILYFYNPDCSRCTQITPRIKEWLKQSKRTDITVWAICTNNDLEVWHNYIKENASPENGWLNLLDHNNEDKLNDKYWIESLPAIYILDRTKNVLLKNASFQQVMNFFK